MKDNLIEIFDDLRIKFLLKYHGLLSKVKTPIRNIKAWYPILKEDQQWDYIYLYEVIKHKLELMEDLQRTKGNSVDAEVYADEMREVIDVLSRLIEDDYMPEESKEYFKSITFDNMINKSKPLTKEEEEEHSKWYRQEEASKRKDMEFVFNTLRDKSERWWD